MGIAAEPEFHVLAVDDSLIDRKLIERLLKTSSYHVTAVDSGRKALKFLGLQENNEHTNFDHNQPSVSSHTHQEVEVNLIITDYCMPEMTGYDLLKKVKESSALKNIPVVIMSSEDVPSRISRCLEEGAEEFFLKPVGLSHVNKLRPYMLRSKYGQQQEDLLQEYQKPEKELEQQPQPQQQPELRQQIEELRQQTEQQPQLQPQQQPDLRQQIEELRQQTERQDYMLRSEYGQQEEDLLQEYQKPEKELEQQPQQQPPPELRQKIEELRQQTEQPPQLQPQQQPELRQQIEELRQQTEQQQLNEQPQPELRHQIEQPEFVEQQLNSSKRKSLDDGHSPDRARPRYTDLTTVV